MSRPILTTDGSGFIGPTSFSAGSARVSLLVNVDKLT
jgi:hypothetical protein